MPSRDSNPPFSKPKKRPYNAADRAPAAEPFDLPERREQADRRARPERRATGRPSRDDAAPLSHITEIDREILHLISRRTHLRDALPSGRDATRMERELRSVWEANAARLSRDPRLIRQVFALLQQVECAQKRSESEAEQESFNLNPSRSPVQIFMRGLADCRRSRILGALSAGAGSTNAMTDVLLNDPLVELVKAFNHITPCLRWEDDGRLLCVADAKALNTDKVLLDRAVHVGNDMFNFLLVLCVMAVRPCRLKFMGGSDLKLADLSALRHFLPAIGARFTSIVPGQEGLPARLESSGILPEEVSIPAALTYDSALAVCLGLCCAPREHSLVVELGEHPQAQEILAELQDVLSMAHIAPRIDGFALYIAPDPKPSFTLPQDARITLDLPLASYVLAFPAFVGGKAEIEGLWPDTPEGEACWKLLEAAGVRLSKSKHSVVGTADPQRRFDEPVFAPYEARLPETLFPLATLLTAMGTVHSGSGRLPERVEQHGELDVVDDFLSRLDITREGRNLTHGQPNSLSELPWSCPSAMWAAVLAQGAFLKANLKILNPGIAVGQMPGFWQWYNTLPNPRLSRPPSSATTTEPPAPTRRRIRAGYLPESQQIPPLNEDEE